MNDSIIFFVLAGLALIFKWLTNKGSNAGEKPQTPPNEPPPRPSSPGESDAERVRRFLEALGAPPGTIPPPPVRPRRVATPIAAPTPAPKQKPAVKRSWVQPLPPLVTMPPEETAFSYPPAMVESGPSTPQIVVPPPLPAVTSSVRKPVPRPMAPEISLGAMLRSRESTRRAVMLREVLGPPRGLQRLEEFGVY